MSVTQTGDMIRKLTDDLMKPLTVILKRGKVVLVICVAGYGFITDLFTNSLTGWDPFAI